MVFSVCVCEDTVAIYIYVCMICILPENKIALQRKTISCSDWYTNKIIYIF